MNDCMNGRIYCINGEFYLLKGLKKANPQSRKWDWGFEKVNRMMYR